MIRAMRATVTLKARRSSPRSIQTTITTGASHRMYIASIHIQQRCKYIAFVLQNGTPVHQYHWGGRPVLRGGNLSDFSEKPLQPSNARLLIPLELVHFTGPTHHLAWLTKLRMPTVSREEAFPPTYEPVHRCAQRPQRCTKMGRREQAIAL
jgi:hypothetical protein